ncbi:hypothetical protein HYPBUDRAFT_153602 [Hyphopichia burtonii NRRL Y-1933]|uniref:Transcription initiation factor TFIID subunit 8 n=1 Tax=Hyphopichia burtonii NRRL Y-1933 TaxID=984485 RepID=A0A1E4RFP4_9ASCO|nr:hypothetical protein HYPBUDRAFT_153602 [Hyphopichia burtonii NRRL Y-1933]ODV66080.1 hypothetical protein HYPBUDRAFT_153602 [Hyphopichia burtonii NRRL Y-1933]
MSGISESNNEKQTEHQSINQSSNDNEKAVSNTDVPIGKGSNQSDLEANKEPSGPLEEREALASHTEETSKEKNVETPSEETTNRKEIPDTKEQDSNASRPEQNENQNTEETDSKPELLDDNRPKPRKEYKTKARLAKMQEQLDSQVQEGSYRPRTPLYIPKFEEVPPFERRLSTETIALLNKPTSTVSTVTPIDFQFFKVIALTMQSKGFQCSQDFLTELTELSITYLHDMMDTLKRFTEIQRRRKPSIGDTKLLLQSKNINPTHLYVEYEKSKCFGKRKQLEEISSQTDHILQVYNADEITFEENDPSIPFFNKEYQEITELVPKQSGKPSYVPSYLPDLPPDYTYQNTSRFMDQITDLKEIRLRLVAESRLTDKPLNELIDNDEKKWRHEFEVELLKSGNKIELLVEDKEENEVSKEEDVNQNTKENTETDSSLLINNERILPRVETKAFDFVEYAKKRKREKEKQEQEIEKKRKLRDDNIFMKAEKLYSPYAQSAPTTEDNSFFHQIILDEFKTVITAVRISDEKKKKKIKEILEEKARRDREKAKENNQIEFGFSFNNARNIDEDSDSDEDEEAKRRALSELKFDDDEHNKPSEPEPTNPAVEVSSDAKPKEEEHVQKEVLEDKIGINNVGIPQVIDGQGEPTETLASTDQNEPNTEPAESIEGAPAAVSSADEDDDLDVLEDLIDNEVTDKQPPAPPPAQPPQTQSEHAPPHPAGEDDQESDEDMFEDIV